MAEYYSMVKPIDGSASRLVVVSRHRVKSLCLEHGDGYLMDYPIRYENGKIAYDNPEYHTETEFDAVRKEFDRALDAGERYPNDYYKK